MTAGHQPCVRLRSGARPREGESLSVGAGTKHMREGGGGECRSSCRGRCVEGVAGKGVGWRKGGVGVATPGERESVTSRPQRAA